MGAQGFLHIGEAVAIAVVGRIVGSQVRPIEHPVVVGITVQGIGRPGHFDTVVEAVAVGIGEARIGAVGVDLGVVGEGIAIGVSHGGVGAVSIDFGAVGEGVAVGIGIVRIGAGVVLLLVGGSVVVFIAEAVAREVSEVVDLPLVIHPVAVAVGDGRSGQECHGIEEGGFSVGIEVFAALGIVVGDAPGEPHSCRGRRLAGSGVKLDSGVEERNPDVAAVGRARQDGGVPGGSQWGTGQVDIPGLNGGKLVVGIEGDARENRMTRVEHIHVPAVAGVARIVEPLPTAGAREVGAHQDERRGEAVPGGCFDAACAAVVIISTIGVAADDHQVGGIEIRHRARIDIEVPDIPPNDSVAIGGQEVGPADVVGRGWIGGVGVLRDPDDVRGACAGRERGEEDRGGRDRQENLAGGIHGGRGFVGALRC